MGQLLKRVSVVEKSCRIKMFMVAIYVVVIIAAVCGSGEVTFTHNPKSVHFKGNEILDQSFVKEIFSASLGFTTSQDSDWPSLQISNPFHYAEAIVVLFIDGIETLDGMKGHHFLLNSDENEDLTWLIMKMRVRNRFPSQNNTLMRIELSEGIDAITPFYPLLGEIESPTLPNVQFLDLNGTEDREFVSEVTLLEEIIKKVETGCVPRDGIPDLYWFVLRGLHAVWDMHGDESLGAKEAKQLLVNAIEEMSSAFKKAYDGRVLISVITSDVSHTRRVRQVDQDEEVGDGTSSTTRSTPISSSGETSDSTAGGFSSSISQKNVSDESGEDDDNYPVIFNIILWFMVIFVWTLIAICVTIMRMDPGRDSIIYRMTTMKTMKKEN